jgi:hypothetical protein
MTTSASSSASRRIASKSTPAKTTVARLDVVFVFFALLDRALVLIEVLHGVVALHALGDEITVGHRVPHNGDAQVLGAEQFADLAGRLALAAARADGADGDDGLLRLDHRRVDVEGAELDARALDQLPLLVDIAVADVAVGEDGFVDLLVLQEVDELLFGMDRDAIRVELPRDRRRIAAVVDEGDLGRRERNDFDVGVVPVAGVEEVKVSACGAEDQDSRSRHGALIPFGSGDPHRIDAGQSRGDRQRWALKAPKGRRAP